MSTTTGHSTSAGGQGGRGVERIRERAAAVVFALTVVVVAAVLLVQLAHFSGVWFIGVGLLALVAAITIAARVGP